MGDQPRLAAPQVDLGALQPRFRWRDVLLESPSLQRAILLSHRPVFASPQHPVRVGTSEHAGSESAWVHRWLVPVTYFFLSNM